MRIEPLGADVCVCVSDTHHFTTDTILLADFARPRRRDRALELGTGCGTIPLWWARDGLPAETVAIDIQDEALALFQESLRINLEHGVDVSRIVPQKLDIRDAADTLSPGYYTLVVCNPPYKPRGTGLENPDCGARTARHETDITLDEIFAAASRLLQFGGRLCICLRPERLSDALAGMRAVDIEPKRLRLVQGRATKPPKLFLLEGRRGASKGFLEVQPTLIIEEASGDFTAEMKQIYGSYKEGR